MTRCNSAASMALIDARGVRRAIAQVFGERPVPELHRRVHPRDVRAELIETRFVELDAIHENAARTPRDASPAAVRPGSTCLRPTVRRSRHASRRAMVRLISRRTWCPAATTLTFSNAIETASTEAVQWLRRAGVCCSNAPSGSSKPQRDVAISRILPRDERYFLAERRKIQRPIDQQQHRAGLAAAREVRRQQPNRETEAREKLQRFKRQDGALQIQSGARPFGEQGLVLAAHRRLSAVRVDGDQSEQRVQVEMRERAGVRAQTKIALHQ